MHSSDPLTGKTILSSLNPRSLSNGSRRLRAGCSIGHFLCLSRGLSWRGIGLSGQAVSLVLRVTGPSPAPSAVATGGLLPEAASLQQIINSSRFCSSACGPPGTSKHASLSSLSLPPFILCLKTNFVLSFNNQTLHEQRWPRQSCRAAHVPSPHAAGLFLPIPIPACKCSAPEREARVGRDAMGVLQGKGQPWSSASPLPTWVSHALGAWHAHSNG